MRLSRLYLFLFIFAGIAFSITVGTCADGTQYGKCSTSNPGHYCTGTIDAPTLQLLVTTCPCSAISGYVQQGTGDAATCVQAECNDGTPAGNCATTKPKVCVSGSAYVDNATKCGCPEGKIASGLNCIASNPSSQFSQEDIDALKGYADAINTSRNYQTKYGPVEQTCYVSGTMLSYKPCNDLASCTQTASLVCAISGASGCNIGPLAQHILTYSQAIESLNQGYAQVYSATTLEQMETAFNTLKSGMDSVKNSKLRFPETTTCLDCLGICPEAHLDYTALSAAQSKISSMKGTSGCQTNNECPSWQICDASSRMCVSRPGYCASNSECNAAFQQCDISTHKCNTMVGYCTKSSDCDYNEHCELDPMSVSAYRCVKAVCSTNNDCPGGFCDLVDHQCKSSPDGNQGGQGVSSCADGTQYGKCSTVNVGYYCIGSTSSPSLQSYIAKCKCEAVSGWVQQGSGDAATCIQSTTYAQSKCTDGTPNNQCSPTKPKWCSNTVLVDNATKCGCPPGQTIAGNGCQTLPVECPDENSVTCNKTNVTGYRNVTYIFDRGYNKTINEPYTYEKEACYNVRNKRGGQDCSQIIESIVNTTPIPETQEPSHETINNVSCSRCPAVCTRSPPNGLECGSCSCPDNLGFCDMVGLRQQQNQVSAYCFDELWQTQKNDDVACQNNFECISNFCSNGACYNIASEVKQNKDLLQTIVDWLKRMFSF